MRRNVVNLWLLRTGLLVAILAAWEFIPKIQSLRSVSPVFDPFFVSSPTKVIERIYDIALARNGQPNVWPLFWETASSTLVGVAVSVVLGSALGLVLSNSETLQRVLQPYIALVNAMPRVALIPLFIIVTGTSQTTTVITIVAVVSFLVFYNAYAGGTSVPKEVLQNATVMGATRIEVMRRIRLPYVLVWTMISLPNAISFGLVVAVTSEILMGQLGMGRLLADSLATVDSTMTFAAVAILAVFGVIIVSAADVVQQRVLHWWQR